MLEKDQMSFGRTQTGFTSEFGFANRSDMSSHYHGLITRGIVAATATANAGSRFDFGRLLLITDLTLPNQGRFDQMARQFGTMSLS